MNRTAAPDTTTEKHKAEKQAMKSPSWWTESHTGAWDRMKGAMERDWEQTKADVSKNHGHKLNQQVADTVKQATGNESLPPDGVPNMKAEDFSHVEPAYRYGVGLSTQYKSQANWSPDFESKQEKEWATLDTNLPWQDAKSCARRGFEKSRRS
jgi:hypothetical protein